MFSNTLYERTAKWEPCQIFQRGQTVGVHFAVASVITMATVLGVPRAPVSRVLTTYKHHGKTSSAKRNSGQNPKLSDRDHQSFKRIMSKNHRTTAAKVTEELNIHLEDPVSTKTVQRQLNKSNIHSRAASVKLLITENSANRQKICCDDHKTWMPDD